AQRQSRLIFPRRVRDRSRYAMHCTFSRNCSGLRIYAITDHYLVDVCRRRWRDERALSVAQRPTGVDAISTAARPVDGARKTVHGLSAARNFALPALLARLATPPRRRLFGSLLLSRFRTLV